MRRVFQTALLAAGSLFASHAAAQEDDVLIVTATRTPAPASALPARVAALTRDEIESASLATLAEALGADAVQSGGAGQQTSVFLRGTNSKHVLALFDGVRLNDASTPNAQYDFGLDTLGGVERVEILRGPASAIYGSDAIGGVINTFPRRGGDSAFEPFAEAATGSLETDRAVLGAAGSLQGVSYGVSGEWFATEGHDLVPARMATHTGHADGAEISALTASVRHALRGFTYDALLRVRDSRTEFDTFSGGPNFDLRADDPNLENEETQTVWRLGVETQPTPATTARVSGGQVLADRAEWDGELQTSSAASERRFLDASTRFEREGVSMTAGLSYERSSIDTRPQFANPLSVSEDQAAAYLIGQVRSPEGFAATGALRYDEYENFGGRTTYSIGVVLDRAPLRLFASYGEAFKAPSISERFETSLFNLGNPDLAPETSRGWEVGADWRSDRVRAGASYYQTRIDDLIEYDFGALRNVNVGEAEIDGVEAYAEAEAAEWASIALTYAWTDARNGLTGAQLARRPEHVWRIVARLAPTERVRLMASWSFVGERTDVAYDDAGQFADAAGRADAYGLGALSITYEASDAVELFARVDNVADETYEQPLAFAGAPRAGTFGLRFRR